MVNTFLAKHTASFNYSLSTTFGYSSMRPTRKLFRLWARYRDGTLIRIGSQRLMKPLRQEIDALLLRGKFAGIGMAAELWNHRDWV